MNTRTVRPSERNLILRQLVVAVWVLTVVWSPVGTFRNVTLMVSMSVIWEILWWQMRALTKGLRISVARLFFIMHVVMVQIGFVAIYVYSQDARSIAGLYLGFHVNPSLVVVFFPTAFVVLMLPGVWVASHRRDAPSKRFFVEPLGPVRKRRMVVLFLLTFVWGVAAFARAGFPVLTAFGGGVSPEAARLDYHYNVGPSVLFNPSIVSQSYLAVCPFLLLALWSSSNRRSAARLLVYVFAGCTLFLVANSLERTTPAILAVWFLMATRAAGRRLPKAGLVGGPAVFVLGTLVLHGGSTPLLTVLKLQVLRRVFVVNSMINYFAIERFGSSLPFQLGTTYSRYFGAIARGGGGFSHELMTIIYPSSLVGTAPVGLIAETWVNFGYLGLLAAPLFGFVARELDNVLSRRNDSTLGHALWAGVAVLIATMSYGAPLSTFFSGGLLFVVATYVISAPRSVSQTLRPRMSIGSG